MYQLYFLETDYLDNDEVFEKEFSRMSSYRQDKVNRMKFRKDKNLSLGAGILLDKALREYGLKEQEMEYSTVANGKPVFANHKELCFNLSHSDELAVAVLSDENAGCDIEKIKKADMKLAERFFAPEEVEFIKSFPENEGKESDGISARDEAFFRIWTLKESFLKVTGLGLKLDMKDFVIKINDEEESRAFVEIKNRDNELLKNLDQNRFFFVEMKVPGYKCSLCFERAAKE